MLCALVVTTIVVRGEYSRPRPSAAAELPPLDVSQRWSEITAHGYRLGSDTAPIHVVEFSDFQCPFCAALQPQLRTVRAQYRGQISILYRNYPLSSIHPFAREAALASACANEQGRFEAFHDSLFAKQDSIGLKTWDGFAGEAGVPDLQKFRTCVSDRRFEPDVERDVRLGDRLGISGTPTLVINGRLLRGALTPDVIQKYINDPMPDSAKTADVRP